MGLVGGAARLADTGASRSKQAAQLSRGLLCLLCACGAGAWDLSMKSLGFMDGRGLVGSLRLEFLCGSAAVTFGKIACKYYICMVNN